MRNIITCIFIIINEYTFFQNILILNIHNISIHKRIWYIVIKSNIQWLYLSQRPAPQTSSRVASRYPFVIKLNDFV